MERAQRLLADLRRNIERVFVGKPEAVSNVLIALLARGHVLIEDMPGVGKTILARSLAMSIDCSFNRVQLTPDLLPSDIIGVSIFSERSQSFEFVKGPIFTHVLLADEINRTTPRTQAALLESMSESQVSVDGRTYLLERPFMVVATQNPHDFEGTYFLPESQLDRFTIRLSIGYPAREFERTILRSQPGTNVLPGLKPVMHRDDVVALQDAAAAVQMDDALVDYILQIASRTRDHDMLQAGVSPRGSLALSRAAQAAALLDGRDYVIPDDIKNLVIPVFAHRVTGKSYMQDGQLAETENILRAILEETAVPT
ncbi:MAG: MoxR family ATPase [Phycisphaerales bacterium]|nr:MAG: MoxR family ATPase [Phycisphaerales bacterium]